MPLIIKYIVKHDTPINYLTFNFSGELTLKILLVSFIKLGLNTEEINSLKFIINNKQMNELDDKYMIDSSDEQIVYLLCTNPNLKLKLISIFNKKVEQPKPIMSDTIIDNQNKITLKLFNDPDFRTLIKIYQSKPELFNILLQYTQSGDIIDEHKINRDISQIPQEELIKYKEYLSFIKSLNLNISDENILSILIKNNGHLNLTLRTILYNFVK